MALTDQKVESRLAVDLIDLETSALLLDVDGTMLDIAARPDDVDVPHLLKRALSELAVRTNDAVAVVSGRTLPDLDRVFHPLKLAAVAGHGAEIRVRGSGPTVQLSAGLDAATRRELAKIAAQLEGVSVEDKGYSIALHFRLAPQQADLVRDAVTAWGATQRGGFEILPGKCVFEIKGASFDKGTGVRHLMSQAPFAGRRPVYIGDDVTDKSAFAVLHEFGGVGFSVGRDVRGVCRRFASPSQVREWLYLMACDEGILHS